MSDRERARHRKQDRARRRTDRWELELSQAHAPEERLTVAYRWCLAEMARDRKTGGFLGLAGRIDRDRFDPAIDALTRAARGHRQ